MSNYDDILADWRTRAADPAVIAAYGALDALDVALTVSLLLHRATLDASAFSSVLRNLLLERDARRDDLRRADTATTDRFTRDDLMARVVGVNERAQRWHAALGIVAASMIDADPTPDEALAILRHLAVIAEAGTGGAQ